MQKHACRLLTPIGGRWSRDSENLIASFIAGTVIRATRRHGELKTSISKYDIGF